jgi:F-type H+-transporting ATPase subunit delta
VTDATTRIAARYAQALFSLSQEHASLDAVEADLRAVERAVEGSEALRQLVASPLIERQEKAAAFEALAQIMRLQPLTARFLAVLAHNRRLDQLFAAIKEFRALLAHARHVLAGELVSAQPLSAAHIKDVSTALAKRYGKQVTLSTSIDPSLIGGVVITLGDQRLDYSINGKLERLKTQLIAKAAVAA